MAKQLNVNLAFNADTGKAKAQIQELQNLLNQIAYSGSTINSTNRMQQDLYAASNAAKELQFHLNNAFNTTTGKFDLSLLDRSLKASGSNLQSLANQIISIGPTGQQAFLKLAQSISLADQPMLRISNRMREFGTVMKNTIKWQLSSSMLHGFMGAINSAYGYAQDLNKSLTDIRIVTGQNTEEMARFAEQANKAAKALSTTTTDYTKASLIYFQQGLNSKEVEERTQVTIKMANATGTSAQKVSDQMTAVWNNFDDGSKSLEYYADVMTALGAATASSTDEISQGLQKFAAVSQTVGLSYEYATAALATITSNTRESADVVGTALKTLFARIQGLQLGETLEDGTNLNKYSQALAKVGISIYESNGELKAMDNILTEMAAKWDTMNAAQQTALAQTVAGVRQYTQLVALMENWNNGDGDSFQANLKTIADAEGTLDQQAEIYAQSWEAAEKRVKAAAEGVYQSLLNDKFFISVNNGFANLLSGIDAFIEGLGGVKPLLIGISSIFLSNFAHKIPQALENIRYNLQLLSPKGAENAYKNISAQMEAASQKAFSTKVEDGGIDKNSSMGFAIDQANKLTVARSQLALVSNDLSESEKQMANTQLSIIQTHQDEIIALKQKNEALQESMALSRARISEAQNGSIYGEQIDTQAEKRAGTASKAFDGSGFQIELDQLEAYSRNIAQNINQNLINAFNNGSNTAQLSGSFKELQQVADGLVTTLSGLGQGEGLETARTKVQALVSLIPEGTIAAAGLKDKLNDINNAQSGDELARAFKALVQALDNAEIEAKDFATALKGIDDGTFRRLLEHSREYSERQDQISKKQTILNGLLENFKPTHIIRTSEAFGALGGMMGSTVTVFRSISSALQAISNPDLSGWEKASTILMSFSMIIPSVLSGLRSYATVMSYLNNTKAIFNALSSGTLASLTAEQVAMLANVSVEQAQVMISNQAALAKLNEAAANGTLAAAETAETLATKLGISQDTAALIISKKTQTNTWAEAAAEAGLTGIKGKGLIAALANILAKGTETKARWANVVAMIAEKTAMSPLSVLTLLLVAAMVALTAIIWGAVAAYNAFTVSAEEAAERTSAASKRLEEAAKAAKEEAKGIKSVFDEYDTVIETLNDCTKGTDEWYAALGNVRNKISEILEQYPDLAANKNLLKWDEETGTYLFDENEIDSIIAAAENKANTMSYASQMGRGLSRTAQAEIDKETYNERTNLFAWDTDISNMTSDVNQNRAILEAAARAEIEANPSIYTEDVEYYLSIWSDSIQAAAEAGANYATNIEEGGTIILNASRMAAENLLSKDNDGDGKPDKNYDQAAVNAGAQAMQNEYDRIYKELYGEDGANGLIGKQYNKGDNKKDIGTKGPDDVLTRYENAVGGNVNWASNAIRGTDANREFVYIENGQEKVLTPEDIAATIAAYESTKNADIVESAAATVQTVIGQLQGNARGLNAVTAITSGGSAANIATAYGNLTQEELDAINDSFADGISEDEVAKSLGLTTDQLKTMLETMQIDFATFAANCQTAASNVSQSLTKAEKEVLTNAGINTNEMTIQQQKTYASNITSANTNLTNNGIEDDALISGIVSENANLDPTQVSNFIGEVSKLNLTSEDAASQIAELAEQYGIQGDSVQNLIGEVEGLDQVYDISTKDIAETENTLKEIVGEGLKTGDKISEKDYKALEEAGINVSDYFSLMADGTYSLTGKAEEFNNIVNQITFNKLKEQYGDFANVKQQVSSKYNNPTIDNLLLDTEYVHDGDSGINNVTGKSTTLTGGEGELGRARLDYIGGFEEGTFDFSGIEGATDLLAAYKANPEMTFTAEQLEIIAKMIDVTNAKSQEMQIQMLSTASSLSEFDEIAGQIGSMSLEAYSAALINLASQYENCATEISAYQNAVLGGDAATIEAAQSTLRASIMAGEAAKNYGLNADAIEFQAAQYQELYKEQNLSAEAATELAIRNQRMNKGLEKLVKNWDKYKKALDKNNEGTVEYAENAAELTDIIGELVGAGKDFELPPSFFESADNMELIEKAAQGDIKAINVLGIAVAKAGIEMMQWSEGMTYIGQITGSIYNVNERSFKNWQNTVMSGLDTLQTAVANGSAKMEGSLASIMGEQQAQNWVNALNHMAMATNMSVDQMKAKLMEMGVQADVTTVEKTLKRKVPVYTTQTIHKGTEYTEGGLPLETIETWTYQTDTKEVDETLEVAQINMGDKAGTPPTFTGRGNVSSGNKGGGGSSGGGGGSKSKPKKKSDSDKERYHTIVNQLEDLKSEYEEIGKAKDKAFGTDKLKAMDAEINKTDELIAKQEKYIDAISNNLNIDKAVMEDYYKDIIGDIPIEFDEKGNISNYDDIQDAMINKYNSMASSYTEDSEEWKVFEEKYKKLEEYIKQYEETYDLLREEEAAYQELLNQRLDLELEKVQYKIELELEVPESEIAKLEYQIGRIEDDAYESAKAIQLLTQQAEAVYDQIQVNKQGLNDIIKLSKDYNNGALTEEQADLIKEYRDNLLDLNKQFDDIRATIEEKVMETFDNFNEKLQTSVDIFDHYNSILESYKNIIDIVGEDRLGISDQFMNDLNQASINNAIEQLKATDTAMKVIQESQAQAEIALAEAKARGDEASQRMWEETLSSLNEEAQSAQEEMLSAWENALNAIATTFEATVERVVKTFNDSIYALGGLEGLQEDFSRQQENADIMLDDYQKIYELSKLSRDINKTIDDTDIIGGKQKLKKLLGEINKLQEDGVEMSQYDLEYLQKTYDLRLAELELEEAQRAKNTVRLSRDNEGNWSYIYTQNTDAVDAAQQKYEDALYAMQDLSSNYIDEMSEQLISTSQEMAEALAAIRIQDYANINDYYAEVERVQSQYQEELAMQEEELQKAIDNNKVLYDTDWTNYHNATGYKISDTELFATTFRDTLLGALIGSEEDSANFTDIMKVAVSDLTNNLMAGAEIYYTNLENAMNAAGTSTGDFAEDTAANIDAVVEKSKEGAAAVDQMAIEMQTAMENIMDSVTNWQESYGMAMESIIQSNLDVIESFNQMLAALSIDADSITVQYDIVDATGDQAQQFDTGGYTGEWGKGGKLAVLHEKELILKPEDTSNFLTAVQITRAMLETIDLNAKQASFGLGNLVPSTIRDDNNQTLEQQVHIVAEFPNVNDHNEIEQAFNNLINTASQYANRK